MRGRIDRPSTNGLGGGSGVAESWPSVRVDHIESPGAGDAAEVGALLSVRAFLSLGELTPDDVHVLDQESELVLVSGFSRSRSSPS
jgi:hypothetical protein